MPISRRMMLKGAVAFAAGAGGSIKPAFSKSTHRVTIKSFAFHPKVLTIKPGDTVEWRNIDGFIHTATSDDDSILFDTEMIRTGQNVSHTFSTTETPIEIPYHCKIHPHMRATIIITS